MAAMQCDNCGQPVAGAATACTYCGQPAQPVAPSSDLPGPQSPPGFGPEARPAQQTSPPSSWPGPPLGAEAEPSGYRSAPPTDRPGAMPVQPVQPAGRSGSPGGQSVPAPGNGVGTAPPVGGFGAFLKGLSVRHLMITTAIGIAVMGLCSMLPWARVWLLTVNGLDGDGKITLATSIIAGVFLALASRAGRSGRSPQGWLAGSFIVALVTFGVFVYYLIDVSTTTQGDEFFEVSASPQVGLILGPFAGLVTLFALVMLLRRDSAAGPSTAPGPGTTS